MVRAYEAARMLGIDSQELVIQLEKAGIPFGGSALMSLDDDQFEYVKQFIAGEIGPRVDGPPGLGPPTWMVAKRLGIATAKFIEQCHALGMPTNPRAPVHRGLVERLADFHQVCERSIVSDDEYYGSPPQPTPDYLRYLNEDVRSLASGFDQAVQGSEWRVSEGRASFLGESLFLTLFRSLDDGNRFVRSHNERNQVAKVRITDRQSVDADVSANVILRNPRDVDVISRCGASRAFAVEQMADSIEYALRVLDESYSPTDEQLVRFKSDDRPKRDLTERLEESFRKLVEADGWYLTESRAYGELIWLPDSYYGVFKLRASADVFKDYEIKVRVSNHRSSDAADCDVSIWFDESCIWQDFHLTSVWVNYAGGPDERVPIDQLDRIYNTAFLSNPELNECYETPCSNCSETMELGFASGKYLLLCHGCERIITADTIMELR